MPHVLARGHLMPTPYDRSSMPNERRPPPRPTAHQRRQRRREAAARAARAESARSAARSSTAASHTGVVGGPLHRRLAALSRPLLLRLHSLPGWVVPLGTLVLLLSGLFLSGIPGFACLALVAVFLGWLLAVSWPATSPGGRVLRAAAVLVIAVAAVLKVL